MASPQHLLFHSSEASCDSSGDGPVSVRAGGSKRLKQSRGSLGTCGITGGSKRVKYSISSSCSSGESAVRKPAATSLRAQRKTPQLFERSAGHFWNPKFDSDILEEACRERCFPQTQRRFRCVLFYLGLASLLWGAFFLANGERCQRSVFLLPSACFFLLCCALFLFTFSARYVRCYNQASLLLIAVTFALTLSPQIQTSGFRSAEEAEASGFNGSEDGNLTFEAPCLSPVGTFSLGVEVLSLLYSFLHIRLYASVLLGLLYSTAFELLGWMDLMGGSGWSRSTDRETLLWLIPGRVILHLCAHVIGIHLFIMSEVRSRSTFLKVGQAIMHGKDLEVEKALKERMIHSVMPRRVADELMKQSDEDGDNSVKRYSTGAAIISASSPKGAKRKKTSLPRAQIIFRPFNMKRMEPVSILFADIVGFTKMSANKSAHALVGLLNDLFGRFDRLCELTCCEKISTLGDCYYCVAGCPEPREDHAYCCVEMGLGMIQAIEQFCQEKKEMVNMRVGIHTGTVLCGILGMKRFKFDVWSNDVNLANLMEQLGVAGKVHLSEATDRFLDDRYLREDGRVTERIGPSVVADQLKGLKTFLISGRKVKPGSDLSVSAPDTPIPDKHQSGCSASVEERLHHSFTHLETESEDTEVPSGSSPQTLNGLLSRPHLKPPLTHSQTSLCEMLQEKDRKRPGVGGASLDHSALIPLRSKNFRERSDVHFVDVIKEDSLMKDYFFRPPINKLSHTFIDSALESAYRTSYQEEVETRAPVQTFASPTFSSFLDMLLCFCVLLALSLACFLRPLVTQQPLHTPALMVAGVAGVLVCLALILAVRRAFYLDRVLDCTRTLLWVISGWIPRHMIGAVLVSLPALAVFAHVTCAMQRSTQFSVFTCCAVMIAIIQYCNFCQLSFWMRSSLATLAGLTFICALWTPPCSAWEWIFWRRPGPLNRSQEGVPHPPPPHAPLGPEALLSFLLLVLLVWLLNREFEVSYRLHYHGNQEAHQHRVKIQNMRDQADWLLRNIIPIHVAEQLKVTQSYSKNHEEAGVIFASVVNFGEFYEESYEGGKECYRVLNELIGDFDELLRRDDFAQVEKIKTIGATYMAASGLGAQPRPHAHLRALFEFSREMMRVVEEFNRNMLGFTFKLRVGFHHGPLTAGVIGTTKLLYDIWGDTVNIASRMDSTGVDCHVQVSEESYGLLRAMDYRLDYRGTVNVKGKGQMKTYLFPRGPAPLPHYQLSVSPEIRAQVDGSIGRSPTEEVVPPRVGVSCSLSSGLVDAKAAVRTQRSASAGGLTRPQEVPASQEEVETTIISEPR